MLTPFDDFPIHQTPAPIAQPVSADPNHYDRYFFNGYTTDGAVFFGAMTYIGNGPNFMVKSIADSASVHTPTFFGYILKYSLPILLPILALSAWLFL